MVNKLVTPLGINDVFATENCHVAEGDIKIIGKVVDMIVIEFDQTTYEEYI